MSRRLAVAAVSAAAALMLAPPAGADLFGPPVHRQINVSASELATGDFNHDGDRDLVVASTGAAGSVVLLGAAGDWFSPPFPAGPGLTSGVAVGDYNGDGADDLVFGTTTGAVAREGEDEAGFGAAAPFGPSALVTAIADGDFNRNAEPDIVAVNAVDDASISQGGVGVTFGAPGTPWAMGFTVRDIVAADFDGDDIEDLAAASSGQDAVTIRLGAPAFQFGNLAGYPTDDAPEDLAVGDFNGDGIPDVAAGLLGGAGVSVLLGGPGGVLGGRTTYPTGGPSISVAVADLNGDGADDIAAAGGAGDEVVFLLGDGSGAFTVSPERAEAQAFPVAIVAEDFTGDGQPDLAVANSVTQTVSVLRNVAEPDIAVGPVSLAFGLQPRSTLSEARPVTVSSTGDYALGIDGIAVAGSDFIVSHDTCSGRLVAPGDTCTFAVRFAPEAEGGRTGTLSVISDAGVIDVPLAGSGGALPAGPTGPAGPAGPPATGQPLLAAVLAADSQRARSNRRMTLRYASTLAARVTVELRRGTRVARRARATAKAGRNTISLRAPKAGGRYTVALTAVAGDQRVTDTGRLTVARGTG